MLKTLGNKKGMLNFPFFKGFLINPENYYIAMEFQTLQHAIVA